MTWDRHATVKAVLRLIEARGDLPALARTITRVAAFAESDEGSAQELANAILDDYILTQKVLKIANSPLYPQTQEVSTVSRAIVVLGWNEVQRLALTFKLFNAFPPGADEGEVRSRLERAFLGGILVKNVATAMNSRDPEQAFICALFHAFGELLVATYLPEKEIEGRALAERHRLPPKSAIRIALGLTYTELGVAVGQKLSFPESLIEAMQKKPQPKVPKKPKGNELQVGLANLGYELAEALLVESPPGEPDRRAELHRIRQDFELKFGPTNIDLEPLVEASLRDFSRHAVLMELPIATRNVEACVGRAMGAYAVKAKQPGPAPATSEEVFARGIAETMRSLVQERSLSEVLLVVLDTIYAGLKDQSVRRVVFALRDPNEAVLRYRTGLGIDLGDAVNWFEVPLVEQGDVLSRAMADGRDRTIERLDASDALPPSLCRRVPVGVHLVLLPIVVSDRPIGLFYVEGGGDKALDRAQLGALKTLRDQVVIAIARSTRAAA